MWKTGTLAGEDLSEMTENREMRANKEGDTHVSGEEYCQQRQAASAKVLRQEMASMAIALLVM